MMDLKKKLSIDSVITKERLLVFLKHKQEMDRSKYLDGTLISCGRNQIKKMENTNQALGIHFYFY